MLNWLLTQVLPLTLLLTILLLARPLLLRWLGARWQYSLWLAVPLLLLWPLLPFQLTPVAETTVYQVQLNIHQLSKGLAAEHQWSLLLLALWLSGIGVMAVALWRQYQHIRQQLKAASQFTATETTIACKQSRGQQGPYVTGWWRPTVLLPADFLLRFDPEQQQLILQHELTHWRRGDLHANLLALIVLTLFWFHPLCWLAYRAYRQDQELACDALVLATASSQQKIAYSYALLSNIQSHAQSSTAHWQLLSNHYGDKKMMKQRLQLLQHQQGFSKTALALTLIALVGATLWLQQPVQAADAAAEMKPIMRVEPRFPVGAAAAGTEGYVVAEFDIQPDGTVQNVQIIKSVPAQVFDKVAVTALQQWAYSPSASGMKQAKVQLDFVMDPVSSDIERVEVSPTH
ncbi:M56 family metallopeptidase [Rheinheimera sp. F8]|uniref:M56 family metallopeptidase n=1 Tax=Rheinheimera sp. F8 TaxID=1763998 RepID=UPI000744C914|nr:M56 family metallopeptidase [Rheinheimera sp. F8]ALZ74670.1 hypothetical protein ATY27_02140 [Rheinheimera sp. F8]